jgi:hypothetical protein
LIVAELTYIMSSIQRKEDPRGSFFGESAPLGSMVL